MEFRFYGHSTELRNFRCQNKFDTAQEVTHVCRVFTIDIKKIYIMVTFQEELNCQMNTPQEHTDPQTAHIHARLGEHAGPAVPNLIMSLRDREEEVRAAARV
jgi:hypothetical protein